MASQFVASVPAPASTAMMRGIPATSTVRSMSTTATATAPSPPPAAKRRLIEGTVLLDLRFGGGGMLYM